MTARNARAVRRIAAGLSLASVFAFGVASAPVAQAANTPSGRTWKSGVFNTFVPSGDEQFAIWRGAPIQTATTYLGADNWSQIENPSWAIIPWAADRAVQPDLSVQMWPWTGGSLAEAATGAYNAHYVALAHNLVAGGLSSARLRINWEFNGGWYRWSVKTPADAANFAAAWRQTVTAMRSVAGQNFSFDWEPYPASGGIDPALSYPGDAYVSDIGMDVYDFNLTSLNETATQRWNDLVYEKYGLQWQSSFANAHHKPIAFPEWGLVSYPSVPGQAGGDDPTFIQNMYTWFGTHNTAFENYYDSDNSGFGTYYGLTTGNGKFPNATALYKKLYSSQPYRP